MTTKRLFCDRCRFFSFCYESDIVQNGKCILHVLSSHPSLLHSKKANYYFKLFDRLDQHVQQDILSRAIENENKAVMNGLGKYLFNESIWCAILPILFGDNASDEFRDFVLELTRRKYPSWVDDQGMNVLHYACRRGCVDIVKAIKDDERFHKNDKVYFFVSISKTRNTESVRSVVGDSFDTCGEAQAIGNCSNVGSTFVCVDSTRECV